MGHTKSKPGENWEGLSLNQTSEYQKLVLGPENTTSFGTQPIWCDRQVAQHGFLALMYITEYYMDWQMLLCTNNLVIITLLELDAVQ